MNLPVELAIEDVQNALDKRRIAINKVGIKDIRHPVQVRERAGGLQHSIATFSMYVNLAHHLKGTHMSRFIEELGAGAFEIDTAHFQHVLQRMAQRLEATTGYIEVAFPFFMQKQAPVSGVQSLMDYEVTVLGEIKNDDCLITLRVLVPVTSLCPCSKKISSYGAHNQRSHVIVTAQIKEMIPVEDLIELVEEQASCQLYGLLKRPDEKYVTEYAYDHPKFVEDMVRDIASAIANEPRIGRYTVECENFESIHNHSAFAVIEGGQS